MTAIEQTITTVYCRRHGLLCPQPTGPACWDCALDEIRTADQFRGFCRSVKDNGPHQVPFWREWAALADDGQVVSHADLHQLKIEIYDRNLHMRRGYLKIALPGVNVR
jgi:hypothetical protein